MNRLLTASVIWISFFCPAELYAQLSPESIFLKGAYSARGIDATVCFNGQDRYVQLKSSTPGQYLGIYNKNALLVDSISLSTIPLPDGLTQPRYSGVSLSPRDRYFLLKANEERLYRRSVVANYYLLNTDKQLLPVGSGKIAFPQFNADETRIAYVKYNNLYCFDIQQGTEQALTTDGEWNRIINGKSDWVYEEELELTQAFAWNPVGDKLAYLKFDESLVKDFPLPVYRGQTYPSAFTYKYPKVGEANSKVSVWVYDLKKQKAVPLKFDRQYEYIPRLYWNADGTEVWAIMLNRNQDTLQIVACDLRTKNTRLVYEECSVTYIKVPLVFRALTDHSVILSSERDGFRHLYLLDDSGKDRRLLTPGRFDVTAFYGVNEQDHTLAFQSNAEQVSGRKVFWLDYLTGQLTVVSGTPGTNDAVFSPGLKWGFLTHSSAVSPQQVSLVRDIGQPGLVLQDNATLREKIVQLPQKKFLTLPVNGDTLEAWLIEPVMTDSLKKYPLLMFVYGGPGNQEVLDKWGGGQDRWFSYLAGQGYAVACVDNRGSGGKGAAFERTTFLKLGQYEVADQLAAAKIFGRMPFVDSTRIGIYGVSYGGYVATLCMLYGDGVFKAGIAQSPVSDWRLYDNIYTERYLRTPEVNPEGYAQYCPVLEAGRLKGSLLLVHGLADDNVHFQHSLEFIRALNEAHRYYDLIVYPDNAHGISGGETRYDLYLKITRYLREHL